MKITPFQFFAALLLFALGAAGGRWLPAMPWEQIEADLPATSNNKAQTTSAASAKPSSITAEECEAGLFASLKQLSGAHKEKAVTDWLSKLSSINPQRALEIILATPDMQWRDRHMSQAFSNLARSDIAQALVLARRHPVLRSSTLAFGIRDFATKDGSRAWQLFQQNRDLLGFHVVGDIAEAWASKNSLAVAEYGLTIADPMERSAFLKGVFKGWTSSDLTGFITWAKPRLDEIEPLLSQITLARRTVTLAELAQLAEVLPFRSFAGWDWQELIAKSLNEPLAAVELPRMISRFADAETRDCCWVAMSFGLTDQGKIAEALAAAEQVIDPKQRTGATSYMAGWLALENPAAGLQYADTLHDSYARELARKSVFSTWMGSRPAEAVAFLKDSLNTLGSDEAKLIFERWAASSPVESASWALSQPDGRASGLAISTAHSWAYADSKSAFAWVSAQPPGKIRDDLLQQFASGRTSNNSPDYADALRFLSLHSPSEKAKATARQFAESWLQQDSAKAREWLASPHATRQLGATEVSRLRQVKPTGAAISNQLNNIFIQAGGESFSIYY